jgi:hypothetical protein
MSDDEFMYASLQCALFYVQPISVNVQSFPQYDCVIFRFEEMSCKDSKQLLLWQYLKIPLEDNAQ